jgi:hypothetical protein
MHIRKPQKQPADDPVFCLFLPESALKVIEEINKLAFFALFYRQESQSVRKFYDSEDSIISFILKFSPISKYVSFNVRIQGRVLGWVAAGGRVRRKCVPMEIYIAENKL